MENSGGESPVICFTFLHRLVSSPNTDLDSVLLEPEKFSLQQGLGTLALLIPTAFPLSRRVLSYVVG